MEAVEDTREKIESSGPFRFFTEGSLVEQAQQMKHVPRPNGVMWPRQEAKVDATIFDVQKTTQRYKFDVRNNTLTDQMTKKVVKQSFL